MQVRLEGIKEAVMRALRDQHDFEQVGGDESHPVLAGVHDGVYRVAIELPVTVKIANNMLVEVSDV